MSIRPVFSIGEIFRDKCATIDTIDDAIRELVVDLRDTMLASPGCVGLAAPQIGINLRAFIVDVTTHKKTKACHGEIVMLNPELVSAEAPRLEREGCMSVPDLTGDVARATKIVVKGMTVTGDSIEFATDAFEARAILHEIDHLDGLVFLDRLAGPDALHVRRVYR